MRIRAGGLPHDDPSRANTAARATARKRGCHRKRNRAAAALLRAIPPKSGPGGDGPPGRVAYFGWNSEQISSDEKSGFDFFFFWAAECDVAHTSPPIPRSKVRYSNFDSHRQERLQYDAQ